jgi:hypothetical protein
MPTLLHHRHESVCTKSTKEQRKKTLGRPKKLTERVFHCWQRRERRCGGCRYDRFQRSQRILKDLDEAIKSIALATLKSHGTKSCPKRISLSEKDVVLAEK